MHDINGNKPRIMGVINITHDSFYAQSRVNGLDAIVERAIQMGEQGADIVDLGAQSSRQYNGKITHSQGQDIDTQIKVLVPAIEQIKAHSNIRISIDTQHALIMQACIDAGADIINDIEALTLQGSLDVIAKSKVDICLMHRMPVDQRGLQAPVLIDQVVTWLARRMQACQDAGITRERIWLDPGIGFDKTAQDNVGILKALDKLVALGQPILVGTSRKSMFEVLLGCHMEQRLSPSIASVLHAYHQGARIFRCHDVKATYDALRWWVYMTSEMKSMDEMEH